MIPEHFPHVYATQTPIRSWFRPDGREQVILLRNSDGFWSYCSAGFHLGGEFLCMTKDEYTGPSGLVLPDDVKEEWWDGGHDSVYDTEDTALRNLRAQFPWIQNVAAKELAP
jgi:hypothetical protein